MRTIPAIVLPADADLAAGIKTMKAALVAMRDSDRAAEREEQLVARHTSAAREHREDARRRRLEIGAWLATQRTRWPARGPKAKPWGDLLRELGIGEDSALRWMEEATGRFPAEVAVREIPDPPGAYPTAAPPLSLVPDPEPDPDPAPEVEIDRDTWCTPPWLTEPLGRFDLDPCSNERSAVQAVQSFNFERAGEDGLELASAVWASARVFINPPYSDVEPWIEAYKHTRFCFLLKLDTSTKWFAKLHAATELILIPRRRVNFIPPPGVPKAQSQAQQFPHALFYRFAEDATDAVRALSWSWRVDHT